MTLYLIDIFFFFQAEDGIRDLTVTGVQTCALPIIQGTEFDATATDNCTANPTLTYTLSGATTGTATGSLAGVELVGGTTTITWTAMDEAGNTDECSFTVVVADNTPPTASNPPGSSYQCLSEVPAPNIAVVTDEGDNCGTATVAFFGQSITGAGTTANPLIIIRTYSVTDGTNTIY